MAQNVCFSVLLGTLLAAAILTPQAEAQGSEFAGLWIGDLAIDKVSSLIDQSKVEGQSKIKGQNKLEKTADVLHQRILLHVNAELTVSLLHSVAVVWDKKGGRPGLYTDEKELQKLIQGDEGRDFSVKRLATVSFDLPLENKDKPQVYMSTLPLVCEKSGRLSTRLEIDASHRSNPFRHQYHAAHKSGIKITRAITLKIDKLCSKTDGQSTTIDQQTESPDSELLSGIYEETLSGLVREDRLIQMRGNVSLRRVSDTNQLNVMPMVTGGPQ